MPDYKYILEDASGGFLLEDSSGYFLIDNNASWAAIANTGLTNVDVTSGNVRGRLRVSVKNTGDAAGGTGFKWRYSRNSGAKADITSSSSYVKTFDTTWYADGDDVPELLTADTYHTDNNAAEDSTGALTLSAGLATDTAFETEIAYELVSADLADADSIKFYVTLSDNTELDTYTNVPEITIEKGAPAGRTTKNTRSFPLGMEVGMGFRMDL